MNSKIKEPRNKITIHQSYSFKKTKAFCNNNLILSSKINYLAGKKLFILN